MQCARQFANSSQFAADTEVAAIDLESDDHQGVTSFSAGVESIDIVAPRSRELLGRGVSSPFGQGLDRPSRKRAGWPPRLASGKLGQAWARHRHLAE